eukprot:GEMP01048853.1.p1 GENE.GEMP01048853.1~~GEMP01048853.1.p1  ORF type:complete len:289 (+),score=35.41 GEMP01048853.1:184-1050(+)
MVKAEPELKPPKFKPKPSKKRNRGYGPLQNFYAHLPRWFCTLESIVIHCFHAVACMTLLLVVAVEHRRLHVFGYLIDAFYAVVVTVADFLWLMDVNVGWGVWTSLAAYQSTICAVLYVGDWRRKKNSPVPPIFPFLTYGILPWSMISIWFVSLDHEKEPMSWILEILLLTPLFAARWMLQTKREEQSWHSCGLEAAVCVVAYPLLRVFVFGNNFFWRIRNWKYVIALCNLVWPYFVLPSLIMFFRKKHHVKRLTEPRRKDVERPGKLPDSPTVGQSPKPTSQKPRMKT